MHVTQYGLHDKITTDTDQRMFPAWAYHLTWPEKAKWDQPRFAPQPLRSISQEEYLIATLSGHETLHSLWYGDWTIQDMRWTVYTFIYHSRGIVAAHRYLGGLPYDATKFPEQHVLTSGRYPYAFAFFELGCQHQWRTTQQRMCYVARVCTLCGLAIELDSSG